MVGEAQSEARQVRFFVIAAAARRYSPQSAAPHREPLCVAAVRRAKVGYQQIQRHNEMALSATDALTLTIDR